VAPCSGRYRRATIWSNYETYFASRGNGFAYDLADLAAYHDLHADLMAFWRQRFPGRIHDVDYEPLTEDPEPHIRALLDACGLAWEDACLSPAQSRRAVRTASAEQVRQEIYTGASEAWRAYADFLPEEIFGDETEV